MSETEGFPPDSASELEPLRRKVAEYENALAWETARAERALDVQASAQEALHWLSLTDEMAGMGQRDSDPEAIARCAYAKHALRKIDALLEAPLPDKPRGTVSVSREDLRAILEHVGSGAFTRQAREALDRLSAAAEVGE